MNLKNIKKKYVSALTITFILLFTNATAQISINSNDIQGIEILRSDTVTGKSLWGLIDGGADLYFEYGFLNVAVQEVLLENYRFKIEIYKMINETSAFGIFSVSHQQCNADTLTKWCCITPYQIQIAEGEYYISVVNDSGTTITINLSRNICEHILNKINKKELIIPPIFENELINPQIKNLKYISGPLGLQNGYPSWDDKFNSIEIFNLYILPINTDSEQVTISVINFEKTEDLEIFLRNTKLPSTKSTVAFSTNKEDVKKYFRKLDNNKIIYLESEIPTPHLQKYIHAIESTK